MIATTITLRYEDTFHVHDASTDDLIGEISRASDGWAAYRANAMGRIKHERIGTYAHAEAAVSAIAEED